MEVVEKLGDFIYVPKDKSKEVSFYSSNQINLPYNNNVFFVKGSDEELYEIDESNSRDLVKKIREIIEDGKIPILHTTDFVHRKCLEGFLSIIENPQGLDVSYFIAKHNDESTFGMLVILPGSTDVIKKEMLLNSPSTAYSIKGTYFWNNLIIGYNLDCSEKSSLLQPKSLYTSKTQTLIE